MSPLSPGRALAMHRVRKVGFPAVGQIGGVTAVAVAVAVAVPVVVAVAAAIVGCAGSPAVDEPLTCGGCNVLLVVTDTLRADRLASYGYPRITSPFLDQLGSPWVRFLRAHSQATCTFPSVNSLLTSRHPIVFLNPETQPAIPPEVTALPSMLREQGYSTAAVSASPIVRASPSRNNRLGGFEAGFDFFDESVLWQPARNVTRVALTRLEEHLEEPFFLYVHYMDPHDPYLPDPHLRGTFAREYRGPRDDVRAGQATPIERMLQEGRRGEVSRQDVQHLSDLYDETILTLDRGIRELIEGIDRRGQLDRTIVVIASDHGEAFLEHDTVKHCHTVFEPETRVPLLLRIPGLPGSGTRRTDELVQNLDIVPTVLDYLGIDPAAYSLEGKSLRPLIENGSSVQSYVFSSMGSLRSVRDDRYKLIFDLSDDSYRLFDLREDPGETVDVQASRREPFRGLREALQGWLESEGGIPVEERLRNAREIEESLRALGYLG